MKKSDPRKFVREGYAKVAVTSSSCCGSSSARKISKGIGYSEREMASVPSGANLGLGCGNPVALASLKPGETVLDLGAGAGLDCFLAAKKVGRKGKVIGVDMTPEMLEKARDNAAKGRCKNVEFRLGEIENIPAADGSADAVISNCVINLSPDKKRVFREAYRVLRRGGRLMVSDIVLLKPLPAFIRQSVAAYVGCIAGSLLKKEYLAAIRSAGFKNVRVLDETVFPFDYIAGDPALKAVAEKSCAARKEMEATARSVVSIKVSAKKQ